jgi:sugar phosphate isomerase/epimerase
MNIGFSSNAFSNYSLINSIEIISKIGYDGIEIVLDEPHAFLPLQKNEITKIKYSLSKNNLLVSNLNANTVLGWKNDFNGEKFEPSLSNSNQKLRSWRIDYTKQAIDLAHILNSKSICITSGLNTMENTMENTVENTEQCFQLFQDSLIDLCEYAEKKNVLIAIEYEPYLLVDNSEKVLKLISNNFKNIGLNFDTCHAEVTKENFSKIVSSFGKKIFHTHISDCKNNVHFHLIPGLGDINFKEMYHSLKKIGYDGYLTAELYPYSDNPEEVASKAFIYLKNLMN